MAKTTPTCTALLVLGLVILQTCNVDAANCTTDEQTTIENVYSDLSTGDACSKLIADTAVSSLDYCMNSDCLSALADAVDQLPDCTGDDEVTYKTGLEAIVTYCSGVNDELNESASASASGSTDVDGTSDSGAISAQGAMTTAALLTQMSVVIYFLAGLL
ncbi:hypothetical protein PHYBOEH_007691 [Phytophthora boehmeriae]|uniref:Elicitin n=1 Tax=Phytophthora boehmeriae TaxID=109152 RepID=A0A8T1W9F2_9STRA|nr:hypothetical protein PHYBOEH_007691 [Phytophthora boehmeriae]